MHRRDLLAQRRRDAGAEQFDSPHQLRVGQRRRVHLKSEARDTAQGFAVSQDLLCDFIGAPNQQRALWTPLC